MLYFTYFFSGFLTAIMVMVGIACTYGPSDDDEDDEE
jgi:hypothetical protein